MAIAQGYTVLIDGYNVIKRHVDWEGLALQEGRERLIGLLHQTRWPLPVSRVLVVFDAKDVSGPTVGPRSCGDAQIIQVRFAAPSADAYIQQVIRTNQRPARLLVVSDDGEILRTAKCHGTLRYSSQWFFQRTLAPSRTRHPQAEAVQTEIPAAMARQITEELSRRWLGSCK